LAPKCSSTRISLAWIGCAQLFNDVAQQALASLSLRPSNAVFRVKEEAMKGRVEVGGKGEGRLLWMIR
jgi:hypothetical protein